MPIETRYSIALSGLDFSGALTRRVAAGSNLLALSGQLF
jgi:hypothetical protein